MFEVFHFPNSSIEGIFLAMLLLFLLPFVFRPPTRWMFVVLLVAGSILTALLILSNSRAGWLGLASGLAYTIYLHSNRKKRKAILAAAIAFLSLFFLSLLFYKADSSSGRKHIYRVSFKMLADSWPRGTGAGKFKALFNVYQADHFSRHNIDSREALLADNTFYAFNDYLQWVVETGLIGLLVLLATLYLIIKRTISLHRIAVVPPLLIGSTAAILCVAVAALFSYPLQVKAIQAFVIVCTCIISFYPDKPVIHAAKEKLYSLICKAIVFYLLFLFIYAVVQEAARKKLETKAFDLARSGFKTEAITTYRQLVKQYPENGYNWFLYAQQLYYANRLIEAKQSLATGIKYYTDNKVYQLKAVVEQELHLYAAAERSYEKALYMAPNRMGSRVDLLDFYLSRKDTVKATYWANSILLMPIKVPSAKVDTMLQQTKRVLARLSKG